jgi:hypothetical protein
VSIVGMTAVPSNFHLWYNEDLARKAVRPFLRSNDPRIGMPRRFAAAAEIPIEELIVGPKAGKRKK